ncbi:MAG: DUF3426 domain-containing protein [Woeseia sp.]
MYTECPHCQTAFRVSAALLRQARGQVQCGGCGRRFDALDNLSEEAPAPANDTSSSQSVNLFERRSRELLKSLGELTGGDNVRIEDTGVEWRVLDMDGVNDDDSESAPERADTEASLALDDHEHSAVAAETDWLPESDTAQVAASEDDDWANLGIDGLEVVESTGVEEAVELAAAGKQTVPEPADELRDELSAASFANETPQAAFDLQQAESDGDPKEAQEEQLRFDDNTPLPDEYYRPVVVEEEDAAATEPDDAAEAAVAAAAETLRVSIDTGTEADWRDLLAEVDDAEPDAAGDSAGSLAVQDAPSADIELSLTDDDAALADDDAVPHDDDHSARPAPDEPDWSKAEAIEMGGDDGALDLAPDEVQETDYAVGTVAVAATVQQDGEVRAMRETGQQHSPQSPENDENDDTDDALVESIVMEGDTVTDLLEMAERASYDDVPPPELDESEGITGIGGRYRGLLRGAGFVTLVVLGMALVAQYVHANRETLATRPLFQSTVAPLYEAFSQPVTPAWDIGGWQFESTTGSTDDTDQRLTIYSRIANESAAALPYPLIHVSLTDRWDDVIGSRVLAPGDYLAGNGNVTKLVAPGASFEAVITVAAPAAAATGFKLNVCYGLAEQRLRCAIEDFRN